MEQLPLKEHQQENIEWVGRVRRGLLADQPGLGKSRSAIEGVLAAGAESVLVVAPKMIISTGVWKEEIERWGGDPSRFTVAPFSGLNDRETRVKNGRKVSHTLSRVKPEYRGHFDALIIDEAHYIKGRGNFWTEAVQKIAKKTDLAIPMTGTPIPNWAHEMFTLLQIVHGESKPGERFGSFWRWAEEWFDTSPTRFSNGNPVVGEMLGCTRACAAMDPEAPCEHYVAFAKANLGDRWMRHLRDDCLDLPPLHFEDIPTPMNADAKAGYRALKRDFAADIDGHEVLAWSQGSLNVMLDRMTISPWLLHQTGPPVGGKFDLLRSELAGLVADGEQVLVMAHYRDVVEACARVAEEFGQTSMVYGGMTESAVAKQVADFKKGKSRVIVGSLETLSEGVTLTMANTAIMVERSFKPSRNEQAMYRIHRMGQERECVIKRLITPNSVDSRKQRLLASKTDHQMRTMTAAQFAKLL